MINTKAIAGISLLMGIRWLIATLPGYIHPDEFFQNPEITSSKIFNLETLTPWEYKPEHAARSIVVPFLTTGIPFYILKHFTAEGSLPTSTSLLFAERIGSFVWTLIVDLCILRICNIIGTPAAAPLFLTATSQIMLVYCTRPFSNSFETVLLALSLCTYVTFADKERPSYKDTFILGSLFGLGVFTRITFPLFALPIGIAFLYQAYKKSLNINELLNTIMPLIFGMLTISIFAIVADSVYYGTLKITVNGQPFHDLGHFISTLFDLTALSTIRSDGDIIITPLNNLRYNSNLENLTQHGLHSRITHLGVNLPLLLGPLGLFGLLYIPNAILKVRDHPHKHFFYVLVGVVTTSLIGLSIIPHQEARFLAPLLVPFVLIYTFEQPNLALSFWVMWIVFNIITTSIFGLAHQGGIVPALNFLSKQVSGLGNCHALSNGDLACGVGIKNVYHDYNGYNITTNLVFYKTYMPPRHLLVVPKDNGNHHVNVLDFASKLDDLTTELNKKSGVILRRRNPEKLEIDFAKTSVKNSFERTLFVTPSFIQLPKIPGHRYLLIASFSPHITFDDMDKIMERTVETQSAEGQTNLNVFLILSEEDDTS